MENKNLRKRKALLVMPLLVIPFLTMAFWVLGGGKGEAKKQINYSELNLQLPSAHLKDDKGENKLSFYEQADRDSTKLNEEYKNDPTFQLTSSAKDTGFFKKQRNSLFNSSSQKIQEYKDPNEEKVYQKLEELNQQLNSATTKNNSNDLKSVADKNTSSVDKEDTDRLDQLMQHFNQKDTNTDDPDLNKLTGMMEKILDIQHPERVKERLKEKIAENREAVFKVNKEPNLSSVSLLDTSKKQGETNGFFGLEDENSSKEQNAIEAVVHEDQTLVNGAVIKLRLLSDISITGNLIPKGNFIFGMVSLNGERLQVEISSIRVEHSLFPVKLSVYDMDGLPGIYIPGAITKDVAKQSLDNATQMMEITSLDPSLKAQATTAGIDAVKTLLSKETKLIKVMVKANYKVLLK